MDAGGPAALEDIGRDVEDDPSAAVAGNPPLAADELQDYRHLTTSLAASWAQRQAKEALLQRVWPVPGSARVARPLFDPPRAHEVEQLVDVAPPRASEQPKRGHKRKAAGQLASDGQHGADSVQLTDVTENGSSSDEWSSDGEQRLHTRPSELPGRAAAPRDGEAEVRGELRSHVAATLQTAEGLGWEEVEEEEDLLAILEARLAWERGNLPAGGSSTEVWGLDEELRAEMVGEAMREALLDTGQALAATPQSQPSDPGRQRLLGRAATRLELALAAGAEYERARLRLLMHAQQQERQQQQQRPPSRQEQQQQQQNVQQLPGQQGEQPAGSPAGRPPHKAAPVWEAAGGAVRAGGVAAGLVGSQAEEELACSGPSSLLSLQSAPLHSEPLAPPREVKAEATEGSLGVPSQGGQQALSFSEVVARLHAILLRSGKCCAFDYGLTKLLAAGATGWPARRKAISQLVDPLLWLPGGPWDEPTLHRLERVLNDTDGMAQIGEELRQAERRQRQWLPGRQRRPVRQAAAAGASQLDILCTRLLPAIVQGMQEPHQGPPSALPLPLGIGSPISEQREGGGGAIEATNWRQLRTQQSVMGLPRGEYLSGTPARTEQATGSGEVEARASGGLQPTAAGEEDSGDDREDKVLAATQAAMRVLWASLDWMLRCGAALTAADMVDEQGHYSSVRTRRTKAATAVLARPALPPPPHSVLSHTAASLLSSLHLVNGSEDQQAAAREGLAPATARHLRRMAASGSITLTLPPLTAQWEAGGIGAASAGGREGRGGAGEVDGSEAGERGAIEAAPLLWQQTEPAPAQPEAGQGPLPHATLGRLATGRAQQVQQALGQPAGQRGVLLSLWGRQARKGRPATRRSIPPALLTQPRPREGGSTPVTWHVGLGSQQQRGQQDVERGQPGGGQEMEVDGRQPPAGVPPAGAAGPASAPRAAATSGPAGRSGRRGEGDPASLVAGRAGTGSAGSAFHVWEAPPAAAAAADAAAQLQGQAQLEGSQQAAAAAAVAAQEERRPAQVAGGGSRAALDSRLAELPLDVRMAFEAGVQAGLREEVVATALARYLDIVGAAPEQASAL
ncbi:hypothetical protein N2152v2_007277 [Parachlorella kessleri]